MILVVAMTLAFGAFAHRWLAARTRRRVNPGLDRRRAGDPRHGDLGGLGSGDFHRGSRTAKDTAAESLKTMTNLAITAQQARADETLSLIRRGDEDVRKQSYYQRIDTMHKQLDRIPGPQRRHRQDRPASADQLLIRWRQADDRINAYISVGNYQAATQVALGTGEDDSTPAFDKLDAALARAMEKAATNCATTSCTRAGCCPARRSVARARSARPSRSLWACGPG